MQEGRRLLQPFNDAVAIRILSVIFLLLVLAGADCKAMAHSWYPSECCSQHDCRPVSFDDMEELPAGAWRHRPSGLIFTGDKVRPSKDRDFHVCISIHSKKPLCAFVIQGS